MQHLIDPKVDCVFKALLGSELNRNLLIHFLNAVLQDELSTPIHDVVIQNPYSDKEFLDDKLSIVDVKARDEHHRAYQIEIQLLNKQHLKPRMLYNWSDLYCKQLKQSDDYSKLQPTYSIWLMGTKLIDDEHYAHHFKFRDQYENVLQEHGGIWILEIPKFPAMSIITEEQRWLKFFQDAGTLDDDALPDWMQTIEMRQAMNTLRQFSEKQIDYFAYQARQDFLREELTTEREMARLKLANKQARLAERNAQIEREQERQAKEQERQAREQERQAREQERQAKEQALAEIAELKALLEKHHKH